MKGTVFNDHPGRIFLLAATLPLASAVILFMAGTLQRLRKVESKHSVVAGYLAIATLAASAACSLIGTMWMMQSPKDVYGKATWWESFDYLHIGPNIEPQSQQAITLGYRIDILTALMMSMVTVIATLILMFSLGYMREEQRRVHDHDLHIDRRGRFARFYFYMLLFTFSMLQLVIADNLLQVFVCWELVGTCSFFLIGFYYERPAAGRAANKAFIMNRIGDAGFLIAIFIGFYYFQTLYLSATGSTFFPLGTKLWDPKYDPYFQMLMGVGIFAGCIGKSAQFPLQTWLPDAMEGPTPVSALIHAATMVAAGVYLCARCLPMFTSDVREVVVWVGAITMVLSALTACVQTDIKRILAFSTCSQLGLMMLALGLGEWTAGLFHLLTHAFFKALLFLCAGSVIFGLHHEQNVLRMGGVKRHMPLTAYCMLIGVAAIIGVPFLSGWYSKDTILSEVVKHYQKDHISLVLMALPFITVILTAYYMARLWLLVFAGKPRGDHHAHESPFVMTAPLVILAAFSIGIGWGWPLWDAHASYLAEWLHKADPMLHKSFTHGHAAGIGAAIALALGSGFAIVRFNAGALTRESDDVFSRLQRHRFYFDAFYANVFTKPLLALSRGFGDFDKNPADRSLDGVFTGVGTNLVSVGNVVSHQSTGRVRGYVGALGLTVAAGLAILWVLQR